MKIRQQNGTTLIETIISLWILGIVVLSVLSVTVSNFAKKNQNKTQALALAKSEYQNVLLSIKSDCLYPVPYVVLTVPKSSFLVKQNEASNELPASIPSADESYYYRLVLSKNSNPYITNSNLAGFTGFGKVFVQKKTPLETFNFTEFSNLDDIDSLGPEALKMVIDSYRNMETSLLSPDLLDYAGYRLYVIKVDFEPADSDGTLDFDSTLELIPAGTDIKVIITVFWQSDVDRKNGRLDYYKLISEVTALSDLKKSLELIENT